MKQLITLCLLGVVPITGYAQKISTNTQHASIETSTELPTPFVPSAPTVQKLPNYTGLMIGMGSNFLYPTPTPLRLNRLRSWSTNLGLCYHIRIGSSRFVISPGASLLFEHYRFINEETTLVTAPEDRRTVYKKASTLFPHSDRLLRSSLGIRWVHFTLEGRWNANRQHPKESIFIAIGGDLKAFNKASMTITYQEYEARKAQINVASFNINKSRLGMHATIGWKRLGLCYTWMLSPLFEHQKGPENIKLSTHQIALSMDLF